MSDPLTLTPNPAQALPEPYWQADGITLYHGDCLEVMAQLSTGSVDLIVTSPPYNMGKEYEVRRSLKEYLRWHRRVIAEVIPLLKPDKSLCWQVGHYVENSEVFPLDLLLYPCFKSFDLQLRNRIVWTFGHGANCTKRLSGRHETILWFTKGEDYNFNLDSIRTPQKYPHKRAYKGERKGELTGNPLGKNPGDVWEITNVKHNHPEKTSHPCQYPQEIPHRLISALTDPGDTVMDPFAGSGTTALAARELGRKCILIEQSEAYCRMIVERLKKPYSLPIREAA